MIFGKKTSFGNAFKDIECCAKEKKKSKILRRLSMLSRRSIDSLSSLSSPRTPSPRETISDFPNPCELTLLSALQAHIITFDEMHNCAQEIQGLSRLEKLKLLNFFIEGDAAGIIENNALKMFQCATLSTECFLENPELLAELWLNLKTQIIPTLQSMCYPLCEVDALFDVQKLMFTAFRDRVLTKVLQDVNQEIINLHTILLTILVETDEIPSELKNKIDVCLGKTATQKPRFLKKTRSKTDSCLSNTRKSVSWVDDMNENRKSSTFCKYNIQ